jgi:hypothetical protein
MNNRYISKDNSIIESSTKQVIWKGSNSKDITKILNNGNGFLGKTPLFFCNTLIL